MTADQRKGHWVVCAVTALSVLALAPGAGLAQQVDRGASRTPAHSRTGSILEPKATQPRPDETKPWSLDDALPANSPAAQSRQIKNAPSAKSDLSKSESSKPGLGRVPLSGGSGSFGFETETKVKSTEFPDGRRTPGVETTQHRPPSYLGLSISVPTIDK